MIALLAVEVNQSLITMIWRANMNPRTTSIVPEAAQAIRKRPLRRPSRYPPGPILLVTPVSKPLARPSEAERVDVVKVTTKNIVDWRELSPKMMVWRLVL